MERTIKFEYEKKEYELVLMSGVEQDFLEEYEIASIFDVLSLTGRKRVKAVIDLVKAMNADAGGEQIILPNDVPPAEFMELQTAVFKAITRGYHRDIEPEEIDVGLAELEKKKEEQPAHTSWFSRALGLAFPNRKHTKPRPE